MNAKEKLKRDFGKNPDKYYKVKLFTDKGFERRKCTKCGSYFWTMDPERKHCPNPPCEEYSFIGNSPIKSMDYIETWRKIERFFVKNGHESIPSYPVVCRWFPGLFFTVASIVAFQRSVGGKTVFEMPAERVIIPQVCLRFSDIDNVGVTGRHMTNFTMIGQHSIYEKVNGKQKGYWKDTCIDLDYRLLTEALGIKPKDVTFMEDVWTGPNAFGYSLEYYTAGLELGNAVFTEFVGTPDNYRHMGYRVIDMGAGLERFTWLSQGTPTAYDAVYGPAMKFLKKKGDFDYDMFSRYARIAGGLDIEEIHNVDTTRRKIAKKLNVSLDELNRSVEPLQALYAIADHTKTLLYAINDGGLLSNVGGGYNLRIIFRRALSFIEKYNLDVNLLDVCKLHARYLKPLNPELEKALPEVGEILDVEKARYENTLRKGSSVVREMLRKGTKIDSRRLTQLYESQGITPELIENVAQAEKLKVEMPSDFYQTLSQKHMKEKLKTEKKESIDVRGVLPTELLFYEKEDEKRFTAKVLRVLKNQWVILDRTLFYPEGGGQDYDTGTINGHKVQEVRKFGSVVIHKMEHIDFKAGETVKGEINWERRLQHAQHHTAVHIVNGAARKLLGNHVWQAGAGKSMEKAHLDITHYDALTLEQVSKIEELANGIVKKGIRISKKFMPRPQAEKLYGMRIYQGGAIPDRNVRIVSTRGWDTEACAGTHLSNTKDAGRIVITSSERLQDGVVRLSLVSGKAADKYIKEVKSEASKLYKSLSSLSFIRFDFNPKDDFKTIADMRKAAQEFSVGIDMLGRTAEKFIADIRTAKTEIKPMTFNAISPALAYVFQSWKSARKVAENSKIRAAGELSKELLRKASNSFVSEIVEGERSYMIKIASALLEDDPKLTAVLANSDGDVVVMSKVRDAGQVMEKVASLCRGRGGGNSQLAQGKIENMTAFRKLRNSL